MRFIFFFSLTLIFTIASCAKDDDSSSTSSSTSTTNHSVIIYYSQYRNSGFGTENTCFGLDTDGYTRAPFYSTSTHDLKNRLPSAYHSAGVYSCQGW